jgi:hypothetical protein
MFIINVLIIFHFKHMRQKSILVIAFDISIIFPSVKPRRYQYIVCTQPLLAWSINTPEWPALRQSHVDVLRGFNYIMRVMSEDDY